MGRTKISKKKLKVISEIKIVTRFGDRINSTELQKTLKKNERRQYSANESLKII